MKIKKKIKKIEKTWLFKKPMMDTLSNQHWCIPRESATAN
ncbi:hypothetical protein SynBIOSE41_03905 [Synechococcus sp. BIOS-E4-1]|nr:hypothetical protein SynBIOSE41_03905 [Synechococcus sp. BIOS-E4-1]